jgi:hypothetical protein
MVIETNVDDGATTTDVEDIDGGPPGGCWRQVWQWAPLKLKASTVGLWEMSELEVREHCNTLIFIRI